jgi:hypothetical protein
MGPFYAAVPSTGAALVADHVPPDRRMAAMAAGIGRRAGTGARAGHRGAAGAVGPQPAALRHGVAAGAGADGRLAWTSAAGARGTPSRHDAAVE